MDKIQNYTQIAITEIKLAVNRNLYKKGVITEEMYIKAKEIILRS